MPPVWRKSAEIKETLISWNGRGTGKCFEDESFTGGKEIMISWLRNRHAGMLWGWKYFEWMIKQLLDSIMRWRITQIEVGVILITRSQHLLSICVIPPRTNENYQKKSVEERQLDEKRERRGHSSTRGARLSSLGGGGGDFLYREAQPGGTYFSSSGMNISCCNRPSLFTILAIFARALGTKNKSLLRVIQRAHKVNGGD